MFVFLLPCLFFFSNFPPLDLGSLYAVGTVLVMVRQQLPHSELLEPRNPIKCVLRENLGASQVSSILKIGQGKIPAVDTVDKRK